MIWDLLVRIRNVLEKQSKPIDYISVTGSLNSYEISFDITDRPCLLVIVFEQKDITLNTALFIAETPLKVLCLKKGNLTSDQLAELQMYLPYALIPYFARKLNKCFAISHFAQTLDGKIASISGDSKWIGNEENLIHAHKMRALCDGVLIGSKTLEIDNPRLNVRHVKGEDPIKIILGGDSLDLTMFNAIDEKSIVICHNHYTLQDQRFKKINLNSNSQYDPRELLRQLYSLGIQSIYIEGGSFTTSKFLKMESLDQIQIHISAKILGSGTASFQFSGISSMAEALEFEDAEFVSVGDEIMFIGNRKVNGDS